MSDAMGEKIRILMVLGNTGRGGAQTYAMNVLRNIDRTRFQIDFAVNFRHQNGYEDEMEQLGSHIHIIPKFKGTNYTLYMRRIHEILEQGQYDIVHGHVSSSAALYLGAAKKHGCVTIAHSHSAGYRGSLPERLVKKLFTVGAKEKADYWFGCSALASRRLFGKHYAQNDHYYDIPNAIIAERYRFNSQIRQNIRETLGLSEEDVLYGHVGTFSAPKNHRFLVQVFDELYQKQGEKAHLVLLGEGALRESVEQDIHSRGLDKQVIFTGNVGNVHEYLMAMDAMIFPSLFEGFPVTLIEAQAAGLYSVVSDSITEEVDVTDCIVRASLSEDIKRWAELASSIPKTDRQANNTLVSKTIFNMQNSIGKLMELYEQMWQGKHSTAQEG